MSAAPGLAKPAPAAAPKREATPASPVSLFRALATLASGALFGFGLSYAGMIRPEVVLSFLRFQDWGLLLVMGGAVMVVVLVYQLAPRLMARPVVETEAEGVVRVTAPPGVALRKTLRPGASTAAAC